MFAGVAACILVDSPAQAARILVNEGIPLTLQQSPPGFSYVAAQGGQSATVRATTEGFLLCANVNGPLDQNIISFAPGHVRWSMASVLMNSFEYSNGDVRINRTASGYSPLTSLVCQARGAQGEINMPYSAYADRIFGNGFAPFAAVQYANMVNWIPDGNFDWSQPDWSRVPTDACTFDGTASDLPRVDETSLCAAATGVRPATGGNGTRSPTMWTQISGSSFIYLARLDVRLGPQSGQPNSHFGNIAPLSGNEGLPISVSNEIRDGFDSTYLSANGTYCYLAQLPSALTTNVCSGALYSGSVNGTLDTHLVLSLVPPSTEASYYLAVVRTIQGTPPAAFQPVSAIAVMTDPGTSREDQGDSFLGDDVIFGFPGSDGFSWMNQ